MDSAVNRFVTDEWRDVLRPDEQVLWAARSHPLGWLALLGPMGVVLIGMAALASLEALYPGGIDARCPDPSQISCRKLYRACWMALVVFGLMGIWIWTIVIAYLAGLRSSDYAVTDQRALIRSRLLWRQRVVSVPLSERLPAPLGSGSFPLPIYAVALALSDLSSKSFWMLSSREQRAAVDAINRRGSSGA